MEEIKYLRVAVSLLAFLLTLFFYKMFWIYGVTVAQIIFVWNVLLLISSPDDQMQKVLQVGLAGFAKAWGFVGVMLWLFKINNLELSNHPMVQFIAPALIIGALLIHERLIRVTNQVALFRWWMTIVWMAVTVFTAILNQTWITVWMGCVFGLVGIIKVLGSFRPRVNEYALPVVVWIGCVLVFTLKRFGYINLSMVSNFYILMAALVALTGSIFEYIERKIFKEWPM